LFRNKQKFFAGFEGQGTFYKVILVRRITKCPWPYRTTPRVATKETPFSLSHGTNTKFPIEIGVPSHSLIIFCLEGNSEQLRANLDLVEKD